jgi:hypothetical protein
MLFIKIRDGLDTKNASDILDDGIAAMTAKYPLLTGLDAEFLACFRDIIVSVLRGDNNKAINQIYELVAKGGDIPDEYAQDLISLGLKLSAGLERSDYFIFYKKVLISVLIDLSRPAQALAELADWDRVLPDDMDFKELRTRLTQ